MTVRTADVVAVAPIRKARHVLLIRRRWEPYRDHWALPGGHVDNGESAVVAARRELCEETGLEVDQSTLAWVGTYDEPGRDPRGPYTSEAYTALLDAAAEVIGADDAAEARWVPLADLATLPLAFDHRQIITTAHTHLDAR